MARPWISASKARMRNNYKVWATLGRWRRDLRPMERNATALSQGNRERIPDRGSGGVGSGVRTPVSAVKATADSAHSNQSFRERPPRQGLEDLVSCVWVLRVSSEGPAYEHRTVPNGCAEVVFVGGTDVVRAVGPRLEPVVEREPPATSVVGVRFLPGIGPRILGLPASELADQAIDLSSIWGRSAMQLGGRLAEAVSPVDAASLLEDEILARHPLETDLDRLLGEAVDRLQPWRCRDVEYAADDLFISPRQLRRRFAAGLGCGPKMLQRILRFQGFLALTRHHESAVTLARLAADAGYADQAHLSRECSALTGLSPSAFLAELHRTCGANHEHSPSLAPLRRALLHAARL
jgi:AraC-like DNA-binding protein